ncbi:lipopolysaccharide export system permease protein [Pseudacidovorax intermedius]|uniref:Lipopolysaccharide export system permease protein LptF n=1 Tax=Pseudacidovorax intermedius TaxID=433924 RepID=A0A370F1R6_9BURK|nr:LPS export ABC transporter permease LptF [Pseudacidovorax intermedius]RDI16515.1 lipopolysaccharide export system permease protein [Pseudacidovorax intermedius]
MLFHSTLRKELSRSFGATLVVLIAIVMTIILIRTLGLASRGSVNPSEVFLVMAYTVIGYMPTILSLSLFISIVGTLSRMYRDSEMVIWFSAGRGLADFISPLLRFAWPVLLLIAVLSLVGWPWANSQTQGMRDQYERRGDLDRVAPGQFQESAARNRVFYIDKDSPDATSASNVFISSLERNQQIITSAQSGKVETLMGGRYLVLSNGQRLERSFDSSDLKISEFGTYGARMGNDSPLPGESVAPKALSTLALMASPSLPNQGEVGWRVGMVLAAVNFVLLALVVSNVNPRVGRSGNLLFALFCFVIYFNLLNLGQSWVGNGRFSLPGFLVVLHGGMLVGMLLWIALRHNSWRRPRPRVATS